MQKQFITIKAFLFIIFLLFTYGCRTSNQNHPVSTVTPLASTVSPTDTPIVIEVPTSVSLLTPQEALEQIYGKDVRINNNEGTITSEQGTTYNIHINLFSCYWDSLGLEKCLVLTDRSESIACHGCGAYIDGAVFAKTNEGWKANASRLKIAEVGSFGNAPKGELIQIGNGKNAALFRSVYGNQGYSTENLVIVTETENGLEVILQLISGEKHITVDKNHVEKTDWGWNSSLQFQQDENNNNYDKIIITYYGNNEDGETPPLQVYTFSGIKYVLFYEQK